MFVQQQLLLFSRSSRARLSATPWTAACQAPLSMGFSRQEHWSGLPFPPPGDLPEPGPERESRVSPALAGRFFTIDPPGKPPRPSQGSAELGSWKQNHNIVCLVTVCKLKAETRLARLLPLPTPTLTACKPWVPLRHTPRPEVSIPTSVIPALGMDPQET